VAFLFIFIQSRKLYAKIINPQTVYFLFLLLKKAMKKILIGLVTISFWITTGCHREGIDNNMNDAYEQPSRCPAPVKSGKTYESQHLGTRNDEQSKMDSTANTKSYSDSSNHK
jgi:hypothetical protein